MLTRRIRRSLYSGPVVPAPVPANYPRGGLIRGGPAGVNLPGGLEPMMDTGRGRVIAAAQDPTDPSTWRVPVVFT